jgi:hypothetical protein
LAVARGCGGARASLPGLAVLPTEILQDFDDHYVPGQEVPDLGRMDAV